jgi:hypothetical protein
VTPADPILEEEQAELAASYAMYLRELNRALARFRNRNRRIHDSTAAKLADLGRANNDCKENPS